MARLRSQARMGYYPTPETVLGLIKKMVNIEGDPSQYFVLDPCCGTGEFVRAMPDGVKTCGIELDRHRYHEAKKTVGNCCFGDALSDLKATNNAFSCLYLNPPYDWSVNVTGRPERMEYRFLRATLKYLKHGGLLIFVIPGSTLTRCAELLSFQFKDIRVYPFPEDEYRAFKQVVVFGQRHQGKDEASEKKLKEIGDWSEWIPLPFKRLEEASDNVRFSLVSSGEIKTFYSTRIEVSELKRVVDQKGTRLESLFSIEDTKSINTLMPLRQGHKAMLLASGFMNGEFQQDDTWYLVKGTTRKSVIIDAQKHKRVETDKIEIVLNALDLNEEEFIDIR
jgi:predicted RNA methylase